MASTVTDTLTVVHVEGKYIEAIYSRLYFKTLHKV